MFGMYLCFLDSKNGPSRESAHVVSIFLLRMWTFAPEMSRFTHWVLPFPVIVVYWHTLFHSVSLSLTLRKEVLLLVSGVKPLYSWIWTHVWWICTDLHFGFYLTRNKVGDPVESRLNGCGHLEGFQNPGGYARAAQVEKAIAEMCVGS